MSSNTPPVDQRIPGADGVQLFVRRVGSGEPVLVYLHGGPGGDMNDGGLELLPLAHGRTLLLYDQRGMGHSQVVSDPAQLTAAHHVRDLEALRAYFGLEHMVLAGLSWGAGLAALYAAQHPDRVSRLLLISPMPPAASYMGPRIAATNAVYSEAELARLAAIESQLATAPDADLSALFREFYALLAKPYYHHPAGPALSRGDLGAAPAAALRNFGTVNEATMASLGDFDFRPALRTLTMPALVVEGAQTRVPLDATREWAAALPNAQLVLIPDAGHMHFVEQPERFMEAVQPFVAAG